MRYDPLAQNAQVVMVGHFNPAIFSPAWFASNGIVSEREAEEAVVSVIHPQLADMVIGGFRFQVGPNKADFVIESEPFIAIADIAARVFGRTLRHTPLSQIAVNYEVHFSLESVAHRVKLGRRLAPIEPWGEWGKELEGPPGEPKKSGGMRSLQMMDISPPWRERGRRQVFIEPSVRPEIVDASTGVYMLVNDHFETDPAEAVDSSTCIDWMVTNFDRSIAASKAIVSDMMDFASRIK